MAQTPLSPGISIISDMITPALLILACGSLLGTVLARLARVVDYVRHVGESLRQGTPYEPHEVETVNRMERRAELAEHSIQSYFVAVVFFVLTCLFIGCNRLIGSYFDKLSVLAAVLGVLMLLVGSTFMVLECRLAVRQAKSDMADFRERMSR